jgi:hypothetical protein
VKLRRSKSDYLKGYKHRINQAQAYRKQQGFDECWVRMLDMYRGKHFPATHTREDRIAVNLAFSTVNVIVPSVTVSQPKITVNGTSDEFGDQATIAEAVINYLWRHHNYQPEIQRAVKDSVVFGHGWVKVSWRFSEKEDAISPDEAEAEYQRMVEQADQAAVENPDLAAQLPTNEDIRANLSQTAMRVVEDRPVVERVSPFDMLVDPEATSMSEIRWIAQRVVKTLDEVQRDERFGPARMRVKPDSAVRSDVELPVDEARKRYGSDIERVTLWEFYDVERNTISICAEGSDEFLVSPQAMPYAFGHPFVMIGNYDVPDRFYPMGDLEAIEPLQHELNKTRSQMMNSRKHMGRKYLYYEQSFGPEGRRALESDRDGEMVAVVDTRPLSDVVRPFPATPLQAEVFNYSSIIETDINTVSGVSEYARGQTPDVRRTATEASILQDNSNARSAHKLAQVERLISDVARKIVQLCQQYMTGEQVARVTGPDGPLWFDYTRDDILGEFDFEVEAGSTQPMNETNRRQQAIAMMNTMAPFIGTIIDPTEIARHALKYGFGVKNPDKFFVQQQPMMPPGADPNAAPGVAAPSEEAGMDSGGAGVDQANPGGVPPEIMAQLQGQVGLDVSSMGGM